MYKMANSDRATALIKLIGLIVLTSPLISTAFILILLSDKINSLFKLSILSVFTVILAIVIIYYYNKSIAYKFDDSLEDPLVFI